MSNFNEGAAWGSPGGGLVFAKRKKNLFKGPMLNTSVAGGARESGSASRGQSHSRSTSLAGRRSGEIIQEEDEDEIEEVDAFSPVTGPGESEEIIFPGVGEVSGSGKVNGA
jgi:hypothetical protein